MVSINIRREHEGDIEPIDQVTVAAFQDAPHTDNTEQFIVKALRDSGALSISLVAEDSGAVIGHVALSPVTISDGSQAWFGLGPISVLPEKQGQRIGSMLMHAAIAELKSMNAAGCVLLGEPSYYHRFGFRVVDGLVLPDVPPEYFQALLIQGDLPQGNVSYHQAFSATS